MDDAWRLHDQDGLIRVSRRNTECDDDKTENRSRCRLFRRAYRLPAVDGKNNGKSGHVTEKKKYHKYNAYLLHMWRTIAFDVSYRFGAAQNAPDGCCCCSYCRYWCSWSMPSPLTLWRDRWRHGDGGHCQLSTGQVYWCDTYIDARAGQYAVSVYADSLLSSFSWFPIRLIRSSAVAERPRDCVCRWNLEMWLRGHSA